MAERNVTMYKEMLQALVRMLPPTEFEEMKNWAERNFAIRNVTNSVEVLEWLDQNKIISPSNLTSIRKFFTTIGRYDKIHIIDQFLQGDYEPVLRILRGPSGNVTRGRNLSGEVNVSNSSRQSK